MKGFRGSQNIEYYLVIYNTHISKYREGNGNPLLYSCLGNPMERGAWQATVHGVVKSQI